MTLEFAKRIGADGYAADAGEACELCRALLAAAAVEHVDIMVTERQRILAALRCEPVDRVPYAARIDEWYNSHVAQGTLPSQYKGMSGYQLLRSLGAGILASDRYIWADASPDKWQSTRLLTRSYLWSERLSGVDVNVIRRNGEVLTEYWTPRGVVSTREVLTQEMAGLVSVEVEHWFKSDDDYDSIEFIFSNTKIAANYDGFLSLDAEVGEDGLVIADFGRYSPIQQLMNQVMGYERFFYELRDNPHRVEHLLRTMEECDWKRVQIAASSPAQAIEVCGNWMDSIHTPVFPRYFAPWLRRVSEVLHQTNKLVGVHADGECKRLLPDLVDSGIDFIEAFAPSPMTRSA